MLPIVDDPAGVPVTKKITRANLVTGLEATANKNAASGYAGLDASSKLTGAQQVYGTGVDTACQGNDTRLSDARTPTGHAASHQDAGSDEISVLGLSGLLADAQKVTVRKNTGADVGTRKRLNLIEGANVTLTVADDATGDEVDVTIAAAAGGSPPTGTGFRHVTAGVEDAASKLVDTADVNNDQITLAKLLDIATASFLGRTTAATGDPEVLTATQATALLNAFTSALKGLVPASGGGTTNFLRADATWAAPAGGAGPTIIVKELTADETSDEPTDTTMGKVVGLVQNVDPGTWWFEYRVIWQTNTAATAVKVGVNFSGTQTRFVVEATHGEATTAASTGAADQVHAAFGLRAGGGNRAPSTTVSIYGPISADTVSADMMVIVKGVIVVTVAGDLELYFGSEATGSIQTIESGSALRLTKVSA